METNESQDSNEQLTSVQQLRMAVDTQYAYQSGWEIGHGVRWPVGTLASKGVIQGFKTSTKEEPSERAHSTVVRDSTSYSRLIESLSSIEGRGFGISASASVRYVQEKEVNDLNMLLTMGHTVQTRTEEISQEGAEWNAIELDELALRILRKSAKDFIRDYGTHFVSGFKYGGTFLGTVHIKSHEQKEKTRVEAELKTTINRWGFRGAASEAFKQEINNVVKHSEVNVSTFCEGTIIPYPQNDISSMQKAAATFLKEQKEKPGKRMVAWCTQYSALKQVIALRHGLLLTKNRDTGEWESTEVSPPNDIDLLFPEVTHQIEDIIDTQYSRLTYLKNTATTAISKHQYITDSQRRKLVEIKKRSTDMLDQVERILFEDASDFTVDSVTGKYVISDSYDEEMKRILEGKFTVRWEIRVPEWQTGISDPSTYDHQEGHTRVYSGTHVILGSPYANFLLRTSGRGGGWNFFVNWHSDSTLQTDIDHRHHKIFRGAPVAVNKTAICRAPIPLSSPPLAYEGKVWAE